MGEMEPSSTHDTTFVPRKCLLARRVGGHLLGIGDISHVFVHECVIGRCRPVSNERVKKSVFIPPGSMVLMPIPN